MTHFAHSTAQARPEQEPLFLQIIQVSPDHAEQSREMLLTPSGVAMELHPGHLRLDQAADFQAAFLVARTRSAIALPLSKLTLTFETAPSSSGAAVEAG